MIEIVKYPKKFYIFNSITKRGNFMSKKFEDKKKEVKKVEPQKKEEKKTTPPPKKS